MACLTIHRQGSHAVAVQPALIVDTRFVLSLAVALLGLSVVVELPTNSGNAASCERI